MRGILITNAFMHLASVDRLRNMFLSAADQLGIALCACGNDRCMVLPRADFVLFYDKDIRLAQRFELSGMPVFNCARAIEVCDDKTLTYLCLERAGVRQIDTLLCPKTFPGVSYGSAAFVEQAGELLGWPLVVKEGMGSLGQQVYLCENAAQVRARLAQTGERQVLFQRFIASSAGRDKRLFVVGDRVIAAIERRNFHGDFRANIENGGSPRAITPTKEECALALQAARALGLDFAGVDLLDDAGGARICEVNSNAHFGGLYDATGVNAAEHILCHIRRRLCKDG